MRHLPTLLFENAWYALLVVKPFNTKAYVWEVWISNWPPNVEPTAWLIPIKPLASENNLTLPTPSASIIFWDKVLGKPVTLAPIIVFELPVVIPPPLL